MASQTLIFGIVSDHYVVRSAAVSDDGLRRFRACGVICDLFRRTLSPSPPSFVETIGHIRGTILSRIGVGAGVNNKHAWEMTWLGGRDHPHNVVLWYDVMLDGSSPRCC